MRLPLYVVDAFATRVFEGNPAAVVPLQAWLPDETLGAIAAENNLSETAFFVPTGSGSFALRWFTPSVEVELCGHATLATACVLAERGYEAWPVRFETRQAGALQVGREHGQFVLDFPSRPPVDAPAPPGLSEALGQEVLGYVQASKGVALLRDADAVRAAKVPSDFVRGLQTDGLIVTAPGEGACDFVSRYFAAHLGIDEDPVTGSAHCTLAPYWAQRLGKTDLRARQVSARGGDLRCVTQGDRVQIYGRAAVYLRGEIEV
ncbi:MAG: PhzF family phenazine biosynthesis protein [Nannocystaceae bacterium]|nr:PhzF family phenazine biosynthesis protein [bacterium]